MKIERVLVAPLNYSHVQQGQIDAFVELYGKDNIATFDYWGLHRQRFSAEDISKRFYDVAMEHKPDWIWLQIQGTQCIGPTALRDIKHAMPNTFITHWMGDIREEVLPSLAAICRATDATLISSMGQIPMFAAAGAPRVAYVQIGVDYEPDVLGRYERYLLDSSAPQVMCTLNHEPDVVFVGNHYSIFPEGTSERLAAIRFLRDNGIDIGVVGTGWPDDIPVVGKCHVKAQWHVYRRAKVALSVNHFNSIERYYSDRMLIAMASGTPVVARHVPGIENEFVNGLHCRMWASHDQMLDAVRSLLANPNEATELGRRGREIVIEQHTWGARIRELAPKIEAWRAEGRAS